MPCPLVGAKHVSNPGNNRLTPIVFMVDVIVQDAPRRAGRAGRRPHRDG